MTNYERIKQMSVKEMAEWMNDKVRACTFCAYLAPNWMCSRTEDDCVKGHVLWLQQEATE